MTEDKLQLKFDPRTIEHLGIKMYSQLPYALAELVANAYDAGATQVDIKLYDNVPDKKRIVISDNGEGMSYEEVKDNFLVIGRKRRDTDQSRENALGRKITGKKGLGKLALFGIGKTITIETSKEGASQITSFTLDWDNILNEPSGTYYPESHFANKKNPKNKGTTITLYNLSRKTDFDVNATAVSLSKLFNCFDDENFLVQLVKNDEEPIKLTKELKYSGMTTEFEWDIAEIVSQIEDDYPHRQELRGKIVSSKKPMKQDLRGITLYVNGRLANVPGFFGVSEAGHTFSYISGWIDADFLDEFDKDLISTDRQSLSWDLPEAESLQKYLHKIVRFLVRDWSAKRKKSKEDGQTTRTGINIRDWYDKVPDEVRSKLSSVIDKISDKPELDEEDFSSVVHQVYSLVPPYTYFHYRKLHKQVQDAAKSDYMEQDFYTAFQEALKRYKNAVKDKSEVAAVEDYDIMCQAFGKNKPLETTAHFKMRPNGQPFPERTLDNIEEGQASLSRGIVTGGRNVIGHEEKRDLRESGLFTEQDCLDFLSLLSHLYKRLEQSEKRQ